MHRIYLMKWWSVLEDILDGFMLLHVINTSYFSKKGRQFILSLFHKTNGFRLRPIKLWHIPLDSCSVAKQLLWARHLHLALLYYLLRFSLIITFHLSDIIADVACAVIKCLQRIRQHGAAVLFLSGCRLVLLFCPRDTYVKLQYSWERNPSISMKAAVSEGGVEWL